MAMIPRGIAWLAVAAALLVAGVVIYDRIRERDRDAWEQERAVLVARGDSLERRLAATAAERDRARTVADSMRAMSERDHARADSISTAANAETHRLRARLAAVDTMGVDSLRALVRDVHAQAERYREAYETEAAAYSTLHRSTMALRAQLTAVEGELLEARAQIGALSELTKDAPGERAWWVPRIIVGYGAVLDDGAVHHGPAATIGLAIGI